MASYDKNCGRCAWPMTRGGVCDKCGHEDDEFPPSMLAVAFVVGAAISGLIFALLSLRT